jgi:DNA-binding NtrC family response regulator
MAAVQLVMIVDPDTAAASHLAMLARTAGYDAICHTGFDAARRQLESETVPNVLVANLRLGLFNGVHLAYLLKLARPEGRAIVFAAHDDMLLAQDVQAAGAFYERELFLRVALPAYLKALLPSRDRRRPSLIDRRHAFRGGRRITDTPSLREGTLPNR